METPQTPREEPTMTTISRIMTVKPLNTINVAVRLAFVAVVFSVSTAQVKTSYGQNMYLMKALVPTLQHIGVLSSTLKEDEIESIARAAKGLGIKVSVARVTDARDLAGLYKRLTKEYRAEMVWIPDAADRLLLGLGFEYLRETTVVDRIGLCVPAREFVSRGALCSVERENGKLTVYLNRRVANVDGIKRPAAESAEFVVVEQ